MGVTPTLTRGPLPAKMKPGHEALKLINEIRPAWLRSNLKLKLSTASAVYTAPWYGAPFA
jgi:hypothetical protein